MNILVDNLYIRSEKSITGSVDIPMPKSTLFHSSALMEESEVFDARALPQTLDISAWLSLVGSPLIAARVAHRITVMSATERDIIAERGSSPKLAIP